MHSEWHNSRRHGKGGASSHPITPPVATKLPWWGFGTRRSLTSRELRDPDSRPSSLHPAQTCFLGIYLIYFRPSSALTTVLWSCGGDEAGAQGLAGGVASRGVGVCHFNTIEPQALPRVLTDHFLLDTNISIPSRWVLLIAKPSVNRQECSPPASARGGFVTATADRGPAGDTQGFYIRPEIYFCLRMLEAPKLLHQASRKGLPQVSRPFPAASSRLPVLHHVYPHANLRKTTESHNFNANGSGGSSANANVNANADETARDWVLSLPFYHPIDAFKRASVGNTAEFESALLPQPSHEKHTSVASPLPTTPYPRLPDARSSKTQIYGRVGQTPGAASAAAALASLLVAASPGAANFTNDPSWVTCREMGERYRG
ncbi:hypothetical protein BU16DRAFT_543436 [Lophium mytilinum]|uniref:Uncharacterized protein n=1 Tax=Lophium mytilinum TaxID=390894 RepID=A0A6A6QGR9_9PEZI|nr:hypothetical protein BU16DRAFT_543436 [Lophium mytilinum]